MPLEENGTEFSTKSGQHAVTYFGCYIVLLKFLPDSRTVSCWQTLGTDRRSGKDLAYRKHGLKTGKITRKIFMQI